MSGFKDFITGHKAIDSQQLGEEVEEVKGRRDERAAAADAEEESPQDQPPQQ